MDSLVVNSRLFLRSNIIYAAFCKDRKWFIHKAMGEYLYKNFDGDTD
ncbi:MAG: hypothetical protein WKF85_07825 [Chitinophagaceae bacterium]